MKRVLGGIALSLVACAMTYNGKPIGGGGGGGGGAGPTASTPAPAGAGGAAAEPSPCTPANDHCLEKDTWFAVDEYDGWPGDAFPALWQEGNPRWLWAYRCDCQVGLRGARTVVATPENVLAKARIVVYWDDQVPALPPREIKARKGDWLFGEVVAVDPGKRVLRIEGKKMDIPFDMARVVVEERTDVK